MDDGQWRAPGRERHDAAAPGEPSPPAGGYPPADPYASPSAAAPHPPSPAWPPPAPARGAGAPSAAAFDTSERHRAQVLGGAGYDSPAYRNDRVAVLAMVLGLVGIPVPGVGLLAIASGHVAMRRLRTSYEGGRGLATAGLAMGYAMSTIWLGVFLVYVGLRALL